MDIILDTEWKFLELYKWNYAGTKQRPYASKACKRKTIYMHRLIANAPIGTDVDHINGNSLDNRSANLRVVSHAINMQNLSIARNNTSGARGVNYDKQRSRWMARIQINKKSIGLKRFNTLEEAVRYRLALEQEYFE